MVERFLLLATIGVLPLQSDPSEGSRHKYGVYHVCPSGGIYAVVAAADFFILQVIASSCSLAGFVLVGVGLVLWNSFMTVQASSRYGVFC